MKSWFLHRKGVLFFAVCIIALSCGVNTYAAPKGGGDKSDLNGDGIVDILDLDLFSNNYLEISVTDVEWCDFYDATKAGEDFDGQSTKYYAKNFKMLLAFIYEYFDCGGTEPPPPPPPPSDPPEPKFPMRMATSTDGSGDIYVTDPKAGSLFVYGSDMEPKYEVKNLNKPLGVAVDTFGRVLIGSDGLDAVEVYNPATWDMVAVFGDGLVQMPNSISVGPDGMIYVVDSRSHNVKVFDTDYRWVQTIGKPGSGDGELVFPVDAQVVSYFDGTATSQKIYVADQGNDRIQVFDLNGAPLGGIYPSDDCNWAGVCEPPALERLQALEVDSQGRLHALDAMTAYIAIFDPDTDTYLNKYGEYGEEAGFLRVPMDLIITASDQAIVPSGDGVRIEVLAVPQ